jgi:hypothetical protein
MMFIFIRPIFSIQKYDHESVRLHLSHPAIIKYSPSKCDHCPRSRRPRLLSCRPSPGISCRWGNSSYFYTTNPSTPDGRHARRWSFSHSSHLPFPRDKPSSATLSIQSFNLSVCIFVSACISRNGLNCWVDFCR